MKIFYELTKNCTKEIKQCGIESNGGCTCNRALHMQLALRYFTAFEDTTEIETGLYLVFRLIMQFN